MDNWKAEEKNKKSDVTKKILVAIMALLLLIIVVIIALLYSIKSNTYTIVVDGKAVSNDKGLLMEANNNKYISISDLAEILGYEYHIGEYKVFSSDEDKCYIQSTNETASFYLNSNKVCKLKVNAFTEDYDIFKFENNTIMIQNKFYAPLDAIEVGFNVKIQETQKGMNIISLNQLLTNYNSSLNKDANKETYASLLEESFDNQKAILYDYIILSKKGSGLYGVVTTTGQEILPDKYKSITFLESTKEFLVTNSLNKMGIVDENGRNKIEQIYDSIKVIDKEPKLYLVETNKKYGVIDENGGTIVYPEYDSIGADITKYKDIQNQYILLDSIIPVNKNGKYGLFNITGEKVLDIKYDGIGCELTSTEIDGVTKAVNPTVAIEECKAIVVKTGKAYDLYFVKDKKLVPLKVSSIYYINNNGKPEYYMVYKKQELNLIERLIKAGVIEDPEKENTNTPNVENNTVDNTVNNIVGNTMNNTSNTVAAPISNSNPSTLLTD